MRRRIGLTRNALLGACLLLMIHTVDGTKIEQNEPAVISTTDQDSKFTKVTENVNSVPELASEMMDDKDGFFKLRPNNVTERLSTATEEAFTDTPTSKIQTSTSVSVSISGVPLESDSVIVVEDSPKSRENVVVPRHVILSPTPESSPRTQTKERVIKAVDWNGDSAITETPRPGNFNSFESILDAYNVHRLAQRWRELYTTDFTKECADNMNRYLTELKKGTLWAIKMTDSSGRYNSGFFWGNQYWMGSASLCNHMDYNTTEENTEGATVPPFRIGFYSLRLRIALPHQISPSSREFQLGICLPYSCSEKDVRQIVDLSAKDDDPNYTDPRNVQILRVRSPHHYYNIWQDRTMWILIGVSALMCVMIALGTGYDLYLLNKKKHFFSENYTYEISRVAKHGLPRLSDSSIVKAELGSPFTNGSALRRSNGDLAIYNPGLNTLSSSPTTVTTSTVTDSDCSTKRGLLTRLLLSFSVRQNMKTICDQSVGSDTIPVIHGLRSISMAWVILGHTCIVMFKYSDNMEFREVAERHILFQTITNGPFSVDTFFFISGLLVSYLYFRTMAKIDIQKVTFGTTGFKSQFLQFLGLMGYRYGRLTVPYLFVLGMVEVSMKWLYYNSIFEPPTADHFNCPNYWWRNALYINTLFPVQDMCMLWSWYLADDTQFYILGVILLMLAIHHFRTAAVMLIVFLISSVCTTAFVAYVNEHIPSTDDPLALFDKIYDKPWTRLGPYLVGMAVGWILFRTNCKIKMSKVGVVLGWLACIACLLSLVYGLYGSDLHPIAGAAYSSLSHTVWALALSWIVIACSTGYGGYVNKLLSATILYPFSRVTYCAYLVHPIMIRLMAMKADSPVHLTVETVVVVFSGQLVVSYVLSFMVSLAFEAPVVQLLKLVSPDKRKK